MTALSRTLAAGASLLVTAGAAGSTPPENVTLAPGDSLNVTTEAVVVPPPPPPPTEGGVLISLAEVKALPVAGAAFSAMKGYADQSISPTLNNQDSPANVQTFAAALMFARTGTASYRSKVVAALKGVKGTETGRALALGRELGAYVIAADLIGVTNAEVGYDFKAWLRSVINKTTTEAGTLIECHHNRPNNWGAHAGGSLAAVYAYLGDTAGLAEVAKVEKGWQGDRSAYHGFTYGDLMWQANPSAPVGVNPKGSTKSGVNVDGVQPDDMRRGVMDGKSFPNIGQHGIDYSWEALQGHALSALILSRHGFPDIIQWNDQALLRAVNYVAKLQAASGDDRWQPWAWKHLYGSAFTQSLPTSTTPGKNLGFTDWLFPA